MSLHARPSVFTTVKCFLGYGSARGIVVPNVGNNTPVQGVTTQITMAWKMSLHCSSGHIRRSTNEHQTMMWNYSLSRR